METHVSSIKNKDCHHCDDEANEVLTNCLRNSSMIPLSNYLCCCHCNSFFEDSGKLQEHLVERHVATLYKCSLCEKTFEDIPSMKVIWSIQNCPNNIFYILFQAHLTSKHINNREHFECSCCSEEPKLFHDRVSAELHFSKYHSSSKFVAAEDWREHKCKLSSESNGIRTREEYLKIISKNSSCLLGKCGFKSN